MRSLVNPNFFSWLISLAHFLQRLNSPENVVEDKLKDAALLTRPHLRHWRSLGIATPSSYLSLRCFFKHSLHFELSPPLLVQSFQKHVESLVCLQEVQERVDKVTAWYKRFVRRIFFCLFDKHERHTPYNPSKLFLLSEKLLFSRVSLHLGQVLMGSERKVSDLHRMHFMPSLMLSIRDILLIPHLQMQCQKDLLPIL